MVVGMKAGKEENGRHTLLKKRPLIAPAHQILRAKIVAEVQRERVEYPSW